MGKKVKRDRVVKLAYELHLESGEAIDSADAADPFEYLHGHGQIIPGLEQALEGMEAGDKRQITVQPADAYGEFDADEIHRVPRTTFPDGFKFQEGMILAMRNPESDETYQARVVSFDHASVELDLNHELAGETLVFDVEVLEVRQASASEVAHGHVHHGGSHH